MVVGLLAQILECPEFGTLLVVGATEERVEVDRVAVLQGLGDAFLRMRLCGFPFLAALGRFGGIYHSCMT